MPVGLAASLSHRRQGQALAYVYFEKEPGRRAAAKLLAHDEARRIASNKPFDLGQNLPCRLVIDCVRPANGGRVNQRR